MSQFRSSPLFRERLFGITKADVEEITSSRMVSDIHSLASKGGPRASSSSAPKQGKKTQSKGATQPSRLAPPFPGQAAVPRQGQQPSGQKRGGGKEGSEEGSSSKEMTLFRPLRLSGRRSGQWPVLISRSQVQSEDGSKALWKHGAKSPRIRG